MSANAEHPPKYMDINCDMGEGFGPYTIGAGDEALMERITSANIACGWHGGDPAIMDRTVAMAVERGVNVGAHPGLPDRLAFGRRYWEITPQEAADYALYQVGAIYAFAAKYGTRVTHWKPHGGFYLALRHSPERSAAVSETLLKAFPDLMLTHPGPTKEMVLCQEYVKAGGTVIDELYVDTRVTPTFDYVVERRKTGEDLNRVKGILDRWVKTGTVLANDDKTEIPIPARSICVHGDGANAIDVLDTVRNELEAHGLEIRRL